MTTEIQQENLKDPNIMTKSQQETMRLNCMEWIEDVQNSNSENIEQIMTVYYEDINRILISIADKLKDNF